MVITLSTRVRQSGSMALTSAPAVARASFAPAVSTVRPSTACSSAGTLSATTSMTLIFFASVADRLTASRTARSAQLALRPRSCARLRIYAAASLVTLRIIVSPRGAAPFFASFPEGSGLPPSGAPPIATGEAAPRLVAGAIAAMWLA